ncbi:MAG TPA: phosphoglycerate mutase [Gallionellaceae bacterium]|nr:phosphoglycerate mutase [Gallionellaceae bacterium]
MGEHLHLAVPGLFISGDGAEAACAGLRLPAVERLLARADTSVLDAPSMEAWLCAAFGVSDGAIAPVTLLADGGEPGVDYWLRADPVHLMLRGSELILRPVGTLAPEEAVQFCDTLNRHFAEQGLHFLAPHPQRWYLRMADAPRVAMHALAEVAGRDVRHYMAQGADALTWHTVFNEIQMLLYTHPVNDARDARGEWAVNSVWTWGGGRAPEALGAPFSRVYADDPLTLAFAQAAGIEHFALPRDRARPINLEQGDTLLVWDGLGRAVADGDLAAWRDSLQALERLCMVPALDALRRGRLDTVTLDVVQDTRSWQFTLTRGAARRFWRRTRRLSRYPAALKPSLAAARPLAAAPGS